MTLPRRRRISRLLKTSRKTKLTKAHSPSVILQQPVAKLRAAKYEVLLDQLKQKIRSAQIQSAVRVNSELIQLYWQIGRDIITSQEREGWGTKVVDRLGSDLSKSFPHMRGFSPRNLNYMLALARAYPQEPILQQLVAKLPWGHNVRILDLANPADREFYLRKAVEHGWSRTILVHQIESGLHLRQGKAINNFSRTLPVHQSELAAQILKDPYIFDHLELSEEAHERDLEKALLTHLKEFLLELGSGFAFVGSQAPMRVGAKEYSIDLLFYHLRVRCYVVIDLKMRDFEAEFASKLNMYLSAIDDRLRHEDDNQTVGLILCQKRDRVVVEYALRDINKPIGVAEYQVMKALPKQLKGTLPTIKELEQELNKLRGSKKSAKKKN